MQSIDAFVSQSHIAHFSMEMALDPGMHTYAGGLGVLAGDTARSCADLELPVIFVTLLSKEGYLLQEIDPSGRQIDHPDPWTPADWATSLGAMISLVIEGREVWVRPWLYILKTPLHHEIEIPVLLLDTDMEENTEDDRRITDVLYGGDDAYRLKQEMVLGVGGRRILQALGFDIHTYHLNEGHAALLALDILRRHRLSPSQLVPGECIFDISRVREQCIFTTHTPVEAGHDRFSYDLVTRIMGDFMEINQIKILAGEDRLNMTRLALNLSGYVNGVAERHAETARRMFPGYRVRAITNGVHTSTWAAPSFAGLFQRHFPNWAHEPEVLVRVDQLPDEAVWAAHLQAKRNLIAMVNDATGKTFAEDVPILGFARRMTGYKRPDLLFHDMDKLTEVARERPFQVVMAGKAHPRDWQGKRMIELVHEHMRALEGQIDIAYLANYDIALAKRIVAGTDVWLNTPLPPLEASGTSGMKAALNGVLNVSVLDGWWIEACIEGVTGWAIGDDEEGETDQDHAKLLYDMLRSTVLPLYYENRAHWIWMMKEAISKIAYYFNSQRMMRRYATEAYLR